MSYSNNALGPAPPTAPAGLGSTAGYAPGMPVTSFQRAPTAGIPGMSRAATPSSLPVGQSIIMHPRGNNMPAQLQPSVPAVGAQPKLQKLQRILDQFEVSIAEANDLVLLEDYEIMVIVDDSGSMNLSAMPAGQRTLGQPSLTRWDELKLALALIVDLGSCFDSSGLDLFFLNRGIIPGVQSSQDPRLLQAFATGPRGTTPLTETLSMVAREYHGEKPILLIVFTDGEPNGGPAKFEKELKRLVTRKSTDKHFRVQIMACTGDDDAVGYLNDIDEKFGKVDVTDDYYSEMQEVLKKARKVNRFTRGDWCMKAMLGPVSTKFDAWDETGKKAAKHCKRHCDDSDCDSDDEHIHIECCTVC